MQYNAVIMKKNRWWIGWLIDLPGVNAQEKTKKELIQSLRLGAKDILSLNKKIPDGAKLEQIAV